MATGFCEAAIEKRRLWESIGVAAECDEARRPAEWLAEHGKVARREWKKRSTIVDGEHSERAVLCVLRALCGQFF